MTTLTLEKPLTPREFARIYGIGLGKVLGWLSDGTLSAINVGSGHQKPRWRIRRVDIERFEARRSTMRERTAQKPRAPKPDTNTIAFFPES
jgi:hypothetical protein